MPNLASDIEDDFMMYEHLSFVSMNKKGRNKKLPSILTSLLVAYLSGVSTINSWFYFDVIFFSFAFGYVELKNGYFFLKRVILYLKLITHHKCVSGVYCA